MKPTLRSGILADGHLIIRRGGTMPTYEYACRGCAQHVEVVQSFNDAPLRTCGVCGGQLRKVFSAAGIIFKGSGYYVNDTRSAKRAGGGSKDSESSEGSSKSDKAGADKTDKGGRSSEGAAASSGGNSAASSGKDKQAAGARSAAREAKSA